MPVDVITEIVIDRPCDRVAAYAGDPSTAPEWYVNIKAVQWKTPPPPAVGSRVAFVAHFLGRRLAYTYEFVEWLPGTKLVMRTAEGPFPMETTYTWDSNGGHSGSLSRRPRRRRGLRSANRLHVPLEILDFVAHALQPGGDEEYEGQ